MAEVNLSRRFMLRGSAAAVGVVALGLAGKDLMGAAFAAPAAKPKILMHRSPTCGCCLKWADAARKAGFDVAIEETTDILAIKQKFGVPQALHSCHTSEAGGYVVEGHVPLDAVKTMLRTKPKIKGIAVAGMPLGAPGMEVPGYAGDAFEILAFDAAGKYRAFKA